MIFASMEFVLIVTKKNMDGKTLQRGYSINLLLWLNQ
jgi:hypothetical protein